ncbi:hypothetical protein H206_06311 [Candidatus Electrothrix aarhusensis]|uniref:Uncharacterized protein n=1 Tax=Candidatus Electrothrix aarhusensis TaxID=1859131 RepID=A0A444J342_9BACT|nr:hypothetical protein H206_06311 [Candidatus Electrothrix aarhusensis]
MSGSCQQGGIIYNRGRKGSRNTEDMLSESVFQSCNVLCSIFKILLL